MYLTKNVYQRNVTYYDGDDLEIFHYLLEKAKSVFIENSHYFETLSDEELSKLKKNETPVIFASTVASMKPEFDFSMIRADMNDRAKRRYLIIDADFDAGQEESSTYLYDKMIEVANEFKTPLIIYPTISYPKKPRFRAVMFTKTLLGEAEYYQAMTWWYNQLGILDVNKNKTADKDLYDVLEGLDKDLVDAADTSNKNIRSNNNAPFFTNFEQLDFIYDTTQDETLERLDRSLWQKFDKPALKKKINFDVYNPLDDYKLSDEFLDKAVHEFAKTAFAQDYSTFWRFLHSVARAEDKGQITSEQVDKVLTWVAETGDDNDKEFVWKLNNKAQYRIERDRVLAIPSYYKSARPLCSYPAFRDLLLEDLNFDDTAVAQFNKLFEFDDSISHFDKAEDRKFKGTVKVNSKKGKTVVTKKVTTKSDIGSESIKKENDKLEDGTKEVAKKSDVHTEPIKKESDKSEDGTEKVTTKSDVGSESIKEETDKSGDVAKKVTTKMKKSPVKIKSKPKGKKVAVKVKSVKKK